MSKKYICIHGHFYQPPRENAWLERIEVQDSAAPYHDWNERIASECYGPNAASRILDDNKKIIDIVNNYEHMSFNFGPTLLSWLEVYKPEIYEAIIEADRMSVLKQNGHGNAIAQVYNHLIMPLADRRDKITQVKWGIADFVKRFGRKPEGMWLAETAVDTETLTVLAEHEIKFIILAPRQIKRWRIISENVWHEGIADSTQSFKYLLPNNKYINVFVYNGDVSQNMAFGGLLENGKLLAQSLINRFSNNGKAELVHVALDGETFGHHHKHGDMALAFCLQFIKDNELVEIINYGHYLELYPPQIEIEIVENSSWSCEHGIERWRSNCGCHTGGEPDWNQLWRQPLRNALDYLKLEFDRIYVNELSAFVHDIWTARDNYIDVILDRSERSLELFLSMHTIRPLTEVEITRFLRLMEMQRHSMLMYTSCGWFFNDISGIETQQILQYACRGIQLGEQMGDYPLTATFINMLENAKSNVALYNDGGNIYKEYIQKSLLSLSRIGLHYAVHALFENTPGEFIVLNYKAESYDYQRFEEGEHKLSVGETVVHSRITHSAKHFYFALLYLGQHHIIGSYSDSLTNNQYLEVAKLLKQYFEESNLAMVMETMEAYFGSEKFSFWQLFKDEQMRVLESIIKTNQLLTEDSNIENFNNNYPLLSVLQRHNLPIPYAFRKNMELVLNSDLRRLFENDNLKILSLQSLVEEILKWRVEVDKADIAYVAEINIFKMIKDFTMMPERTVIEKINETLQFFSQLDIPLNLWQSQNCLFNFAKRALSGFDIIKQDKVLLNEFNKLSLRLDLNI